jgi:hypothetical protein
MRKFTTIGLALTGLWTMLSGLQMMIVPPVGGHAQHVAPAFFFIIFMGLHTWLNWKPFVLRFKGLGWRWALVGFALVVIVFASFGNNI